ncbi:radical SAM protein [Myxococcota bacterium]|nr:radical SAM protein [Myxococcota bacterium]MBU1379807.1 radical SAM protein [Myxococcota bacterium]MBU1497129.1 radical SAM protein [Myxococcota bacterium]
MYEKPLGYAVFELTNRCNLRCPFCASASGIPRENEMPTARWLEIIDEMASLGGKEVTLIGGEIFLFDDWEIVAQRIKASGMDLVVITNGLLVDDVTFKKLMDLNVSVMGISIDGPDRDSYKETRGVDGFDYAWNLANRFKNEGLEYVNVITTLTSVNYHRIDDFADLMRNTDMTWQVQIASAGGERHTDDLAFTVAMYEEVYNKLSYLIKNDPDLKLGTMDDFGYFPLDCDLQALHSDWKGCQGGKQLIGIRANGDLLPCLSMGSNFVVANLNEIALSTAWTCDETFRQFREKHLHLEGFCRTCPVSSACKAGCSAMAWTTTGSIYSNDYCIRKIQSLNLIRDLDL